MHKIIELIYNEKKISTHISIIVGLGAGLLSYVDYDLSIVPATVIAVIGYCLATIIITPITKILEEKQDTKRYLQKYSESELLAIKVFTDNGMCVVSYEAYEKGLFNKNGLSSLLNRGIVRKFGDYNFNACEENRGFELDEYVFTRCLNNI